MDNVDNIQRQEKGFDLSGKNLMIGIPAYDHKVTTKCMLSLVKLGQRVLQHGINITLSTVCGCSVVSRARNMIAQEFLDSDCDNLLFIDADIGFEPDSILRLFAWNQSRAIVAGAYEARKKGKVFILTLDGDGDNIIMDDAGLVKARRVATGFMMIQRRVFTTLAEKHPEWRHKDTNTDKILYSFFDFKSEPEGYMGEDFLFCKRVCEAGMDDIWIDPTIKLSHMGIHEYESDFGNDILYSMLKPKEQTMSDAA